jgi:hypothetical protein
LIRIAETAALTPRRPATLSTATIAGIISHMGDIELDRIMVAFLIAAMLFAMRALPGLCSTVETFARATSAAIRPPATRFPARCARAAQRSLFDPLESF